MAASECEREARKRRERRDSGCAHERKERRPHSEERAPPAQPPPPPLQDCNRLESERRAERLSRARRPQYGGKRRRQPLRVNKHQDFYKTKENECLLPEDERNVSPAPTESVSPVQKHFYEQISNPEGLDLAALHRQLDREEPARSYAAERARPEDPTPEPRRPGRDTFHPERRLEKINKKINVLKKNIAKHESDFESTHGYPITVSERITDVQLTRMYETLRRLQNEKRCIKADPVEYALKIQVAKQQKERDEKLDQALTSDKTMNEVVIDIEEWLEGCRQAAGRTTAETTWTASQLAAEKSCVQRALLRLEAARGRPPAHSAERGAARHLYERYRSVKRALAAIRPDAVICINNELATIHEHEAMLFNSSVDSSSDSQDRQSDTEQDEASDTPLQSPPTRDAEEPPSTTSSGKSGTSEETPAANNEGLHCLGLEELAKALSEAKLHKCVLRRTIKEYEVSFEVQNSRKVQRDDKKSREDEYLRYKAIKARIKLLNALINKQKIIS